VGTSRQSARTKRQRGGSPRRYRQWLKRRNRADSALTNLCNRSWRRMNTEEGKPIRRRRLYNAVRPSHADEREAPGHGYTSRKGSRRSSYSSLHQGDCRRLQDPAYRPVRRAPCDCNFLIAPGKYTTDCNEFSHGEIRKVRASPTAAEVAQTFAVLRAREEMQRVHWAPCVAGVDDDSVAARSNPRSSLINDEIREKYASQVAELDNIRVLHLLQCGPLGAQDQGAAISLQSRYAGHHEPQGSQAALCGPVPRADADHRISAATTPFLEEPCRYVLWSMLLSFCVPRSPVPAQNKR